MFVVIYCSDHKKKVLQSATKFSSLLEKGKKKKIQSFCMFALSFCLHTHTHVLFTVILARVFENDVI